MVYACRICQYEEMVENKCVYRNDLLTVARYVTAYFRLSTIDTLWQWESRSHHRSWVGRDVGMLYQSFGYQSPDFASHRPILTYRAHVAEMTSTSMPTTSPLRLSNLCAVLSYTKISPNARKHAWFSFMFAPGVTTVSPILHFQTRIDQKRPMNNQCSLCFHYPYCTGGLHVFYFTLRCMLTPTRLLQIPCINNKGINSLRSASNEPFMFNHCFFSGVMLNQKYPGIWLTSYKPVSHWTSPSFGDLIYGAS